MKRCILGVLLVTALILSLTFCSSDSGQSAGITINIYPTTLPLGCPNTPKASIMALPRDARGNSLPDGTTVEFSAEAADLIVDVGSFEESTVGILQGMARTKYCCGNEAGKVNIRALVPSMGLSGSAQVTCAGAVVTDGGSTTGAYTIELTANPSILLVGGNASAVKAVVQQGGVQASDGTVLTFKLFAPSDGGTGFGSLSSTTQSDVQELEKMTTGGEAEILFKSGDAEGQGSIVACVKGTTSCKTVFISVQGSTAVGNITFVSASPPVLRVKGFGAAEESILKFKITDSNGNPVLDGVQATFSIQESRLVQSSLTSQNSWTTGGLGIVQTTLQSGRRREAVTVMAQFTQFNETRTATTTIDVLSGRPTPQNMFLECDCSVVFKGTDQTCSVLVGDRYHNPAVSGTVVNFLPEFGVFQAPPWTLGADGKATVTLNAPFGPGALLPDNGLVSIISVVQGEEEFVDINGNGQLDAPDGGVNPICPSSHQYDGGVYLDGGVGMVECFYDMPDPFVDANDDGKWQYGEKLEQLEAPQDTWSAGDMVWNASTRIWKQTKVLWVEDLDLTLSHVKVGSPLAMCDLDTPFTIPMNGSIPMNMRFVDGKQNCVSPCGQGTYNITLSGGGQVIGSSYSIPEQECFDPETGDNLVRSYSAVLRDAEVEAHPPVNVTLNVTYTYPSPRGTIKAEWICPGIIQGVLDGGTP